MIRKLLIGAGALLTVLLFTAFGLMACGTARLNAVVSLQPEALHVPTDAASVANGERLVAIYHCAECHGGNLGGDNMIDSAAFMRLPAPNLTRGKGGMAGRLSAAQWEAAIRHGVGHDGRSLVIMPSNLYTQLTDADVAAIIAHFENTPPIDAQLIDRGFGPVGRIVAALSADDLLAARVINHTAIHRADLQTADVSEVGEYLSQICSVCHGEDFAGASLDFAPDIFAPNLTPDPDSGIGGWTLADFTRLLREGKRPDGTMVSINMPWAGFARYSDDEIAALWTYLAALPPVRSGQP